METQSQENNALHSYCTLITRVKQSVYEQGGSRAGHWGGGV